MLHLLHAPGMNQLPPLLTQAAEHHEALPPRVREYLHRRGIPDPLIDFFLLGWNGSRITIPVFDREGAVAFFKLGKDPEDQTDSPKMLATPGAHAELYGWEDVLHQPEEIVICEGEFDRLVLKGQGFRAVTSTGGARVFRADWAGEFASIPNVYICFDFDAAGLDGALNVGRLIPHAKMIELPEEVGEGGDVSDFFVRLGRTDDDFRVLMASAMPVRSQPSTEPRVREPRPLDSALRQRIERLKHIVPITEVIGRYVDLRCTGNTCAGLCPFHKEEVASF